MSAYGVEWNTTASTATKAEWDVDWDDQEGMLMGKPPLSPTEYDQRVKELTDFYASEEFEDLNQELENA